MRLLSNQTADGVSEAQRVDGGEYLFQVQGNFGGGTVTLEYKMDDIPDFTVLADATATSEGVSVVKLAPGNVRAELSGATNASIYAAVARVETLVIPEPETELVDILFESSLDGSITVSRTGTATIRNATGAWEEVAANLARFHHNRNGEYLGLLSEGTRTNRLHDSENPASQTVNLPSTDFYTLWMEGTGSVVVSENTATGIGFGTASEGNPVTFQITGTGTVDVTVNGTVDRFQLERRAHQSTFIPTPSGAAETRGTELLFISDITDLYNEGGTTFLVRGYAPPSDANNPYILSLDDGAASPASQESLGIRIDSAGNVAVHVIVGGVEEAALPLGTLSQYQYFSVALRVASGSIAASLDGAPVQTASGISMPSVSRFNVGSMAETNHWYAPIRQVRVYKDALSDAELRSLSESTTQVPEPDPASSETLALVLGPNTSSPTTNQPAKPAKGNAYVDPHFGVTGLTYHRVSNAHADIAASEALKTTYPRRNPFNSDGSMMLLEDTPTDIDGDRYMHIVNPNTGAIIHSPFYTGPDTSRSYHRLENVWHYTNPNLMFALAADPEMSSPPVGDRFKVNVLDLSNVTGGVPARTVIIDLTNVNFAAATGYAGSTSITDVWSTAFRIWTRREGTPSKTVVDAGKTWAGYPRYWAFQVDNSGAYNLDSSGLGAITYDLQTNTITGVLDYSSVGRTGADHVDMSPNGDYIAVGWANTNACSSGTGTFSSPCGLMIYNRDFSDGFGIRRSAPHSDFALDADHNDAYVWIDFDTGTIKYTVCNTRLTYTILDLGSPVGGDFHISANCFNKPGYVLLSPYDTSPGTAPAVDQWYLDKILIAELVPTNARVWVVGHNYHGYPGNDDGAPHATVNYDFTRIGWGANWTPRSSGATVDMDVYMIKINGELP